MSKPPKYTRKRKQPEKEVEYEIETPKMYKLSAIEHSQEEEKLSQILFGGSSSFLESLEEAEKEVGCSKDIDSGVGEDDSGESDGAERKPAWTDEDDDGIEVGQALDAQRRKLPDGGINSHQNKYSDLLKNKYEAIVGTPKWANLSKKRTRSNSDSDEELLRSCGFIKKAPRTSVLSGLLEFKKVKDLNCETYSEGPYINAIEFHPTSTVGLVAGNKGIATLYAVDGKKNNKLHSVAFQNYPIMCAKFLQNGNEAVLGSRHKHIYTYDLLAAKAIRYNLPPGLTQCKNFVVSPDSQYISVAGKWGEVYVLSAISKEKVFTLKQNSDVTALEYSPGGNFLFGHSDTGEITVWDINTRRVKHKFSDDGCLKGTTISISPSNQFIATGSAQGVVNLYSMEDVLKNKIPKPRRSILNLTTEINALKFNSTSEIIALASSEIKNAVKLFHVGSGTVFSNFPPFESKLGEINRLSFSPSSGFLALANRTSVVALYRLKHFKNY